jgi:hypothetical protein
MMNNSRPVSVWTLVTFLLILAMCGILGGYTLASDPSGKSMGLAEVLPLLPVSDFLLPGIFLFVVMGVIPFALAYSLMARKRSPLAESLTGWSKHHWSWTSTVLLGIVLVVFLVMESAYVGFHIPFQYVTAFLVFGIMVTAFLPEVEKIYRI